MWIYSLPLAAERNAEMFITVLKRHPHFEVTQQMLYGLVRKTALRSAAMDALSKHAPPWTLKIDDGIIISSVRAAYNGSSLIQWLLNHYKGSPEDGIPENILVAAVGCNDAIRILDTIESFQPNFRVTPKFLTVAVSEGVPFSSSEDEVLRWLFQHDPHCEIDEDLLTEALKRGNYNTIRLLLSRETPRPTLPMISACKNLPTLELLVTLGESISIPDIVDAITEAALQQGTDEECIIRVLGRIQKQHIRIMPAALRAAAANTFTASALQWVLDHASTLEITSSIFEHAAHGSSNLKKMELLAKRSPGVKITEEILQTVCEYGDVKALQWVLDRIMILHILRLGC